MKYLLGITWKKKYIRELLLLILLYIVSFYTMYFTIKSIQLAFIALLLVVFIISKNNYFWLAFFFLIFQMPAGIFSGGQLASYGRLPYFSILPGASFTTIEIFVFIAFIKAALMKTAVNIPFKRPLQLLLIYLVFIFIQSFLFGMTSNTVIYTCRVLLFLSLFYTIPVILKSREDYFFFIFLVIPFIIMDFGGQIYEIETGHKPFKIISENLEVLSTSDFSGGLRTDISSYLNFFTVFFSLFLLSLKGKTNKILILTVLCMSILSIFLTATRGWILSYSIMVIFFIFLNINTIGKTIKWGIIGLILIILIFKFIPDLKIQSGNSLLRFSTLENVMQGDVSAKGTLSRLNSRSPEVMANFYKNFLTGFGFSDTVSSDTHVGNQNLLMTTGIIGYGLFFYFLLYFSYKILLTTKKISFHNPYKKALKVFIIGLFGLFLIHSTSTQMFGFDPGFGAQQKLFLLSLFFSSAGFFIEDAIIVERSYNNPVRYN
jgi:hypothetical protein